uniref:Pericentriolar material 1 protein isoform X4 n=1 Tax=Geotrypetes seraphini TaxID=260995 RepID=A0A6P8QVT9_GEOSA|nr:pericentriolar material 1 protein isoform X4 [Geotrypetes seraphini]
MATGGGPFEEGINDQDMPTWSSEGLDDRLNNMDWRGPQKKVNRSSDKNKKKIGVGGETRLTNDISPESSPGVGRRKTKTPHTFPHTRYVTQMSVPEQAELERLKQRINFSDLDQRSIGSDSQGRATAANNKRQLSENRRTFNLLPLQINTNKGKDVTSPPKKEISGPSQCKDFASVLSQDSLQNYQVSVEDGRGEPAIDSGQVVTRLIKIRDYITKARSMRDDLVEKNERSANVERLSHLIDHLKDQEKSYLKFLQKMLARENEEDDGRTIDSAVGSGSVGESTSLNIDVRSDASDNTEVSLSLRIRPRIEDNLGNSASRGQVADIDITASPKGKGDKAALNGREILPNRINSQEHGLLTKAIDRRQEAKEELENLKKQHDLLKKMLQQQEQLRALQGRQAALLALQHKAEQAIAVMDDTGVTETTGSISGLSLTSELNEELNDLIQRFHNHLHNSQVRPVPDNRRQAETLSLTREIAQSRNSSVSETVSEDKVQLFSKMKVLQEKKEKMDKFLGELHTLHDHQLNNSLLTSGSPQKSAVPRSTNSVASASLPVVAMNGDSNCLSSAAYPSHSISSLNESEDEENLNATEKLKKLKEVRKRLNELRELVHYYEQTSDMITDAVNENTKENEEDTESEFESEQDIQQSVRNIRNPQIGNWVEMNINANAQCGTNNQDGHLLNTSCEINNKAATNLRTLNLPSNLDCLQNRNANNKDIDRRQDEDAEEDQASEASLSSQRSSLVDDDEPVDAEFEQKFNRLLAAKQKLKQLQDLVAMVQDGEEVEVEGAAATRANLEDIFSAVDEDTKQQLNNISHDVKTQQDVALNEKAREKFYEAKLQQQQKELKQLQEERKKLIGIQEKIQELQKACPDLKLSTPTIRNCLTKQPPVAASTPGVHETNISELQAIPDPEDSTAVDSELWSEIRRHQILREELRQRRKHLETLMAEHQRRKGRGETVSAAASVRSDGSDTLCTQQQSRTEKTMATWGGSTQCALDEEDGDEECYPSDGVQAAEDEEEEEQESSSNENFPIYSQNSTNQGTHNAKRNKERWRNLRPFSVDGNYRPLAKTRQQNVNMRRQENLRWASELSYVEEKEHWQEQINQLKKQLEFSTSICQTLMQDQQTLSCLLQNLLTSPYSVMPGNVGSPQVHFIMHQLNQCYSQLSWQQNNVHRLKQMLNDLARQQQEQLQGKPQRKEKGNSVPPPSPTVCPFSFPAQPMSLFNVPGFSSFSSVTPGMCFNPGFLSGFGDCSQNNIPQNSELPQSQDHISGKTEYTAFPKPFESNSSSGGEKQRSQDQPVDEVNQSRSVWSNDNQGGQVEKRTLLKTTLPVPIQNLASGNHKKLLDNGRRRRQLDEESLESFSSMPDPMDPTTVTKTFKSRKASAQASLASKDKTPKLKNKKRKSSQTKCKGVTDFGLESASVSSTGEINKSRNKHLQTEETVETNTLNKSTREQLERIIKCSRSTEMSSETGSDFSMFEALRDTIYSEVATLISQNESRPHYLIELFHELQLLNTDYLRQRALYALQDIVTRHISETTEKEREYSKSLNSAVWMASNSELTPSESLATTDEETFEKDLAKGPCQLDEQNEVDNASTLSTSSNFEPFATDDLGNTVIHLDQAMARMREYERMKIEAGNNMDSEGRFSNIEGTTTDNLEASSVGENHAVQHPNNVPFVPCPRIDTQQLDQQIKSIMKEVIPFLKEHIESVCCTQLLTSIRRMVLTLTQQNDESKEFVKFFHKQLGSILQDSLAKFAGRKLKDCGEDLLVEISEVLFNELAFFRLMQDLDNNSIAGQQQCRRLEMAGILQRYPKETKRICDEDACSPAGYIDDEDKDKDETETSRQTQPSDVQEDSKVKRRNRSDTSDQEEDENEHQPVSISLSKAETQALTNYGSGEDENECEETDEFEAGPVDVQTSLQVNNENTDENEKDLKVPEQESEKVIEHENILSEDGDSKSADEMPSELQECISVLEIQQQSGDMENTIVNIKDPPDMKHTPPLNEENNMMETVPVYGEAKSSTVTPESSMTSSPETQSPVLVNEYETGSGNISQKSDEEDFVKLEDLPLKLLVSENLLQKEHLELPCCEQTDMMEKIVEEQQRNNLCEEILTTTNSREYTEGLAGDPQAIKEPETAGGQSA